MVRAEDIMQTTLGEKSVNWIIKNDAKDEVGTAIKSTELITPPFYIPKIFAAAAENIEKCDPKHK